MTLMIVFSDEALMDLANIHAFITDDNVSRATAYVSRISTACRDLTQTPYIGVSREDIRTGLRLLPLWRKIVVAYQVTDRELRILRVFSGGQDYAALMTGDQDT